MLEVIGEAPVNALEGSQVGEAHQAAANLREFHRDGQARGWTWNRERSFPFVPEIDADGFRAITVPANLAVFNVADRARWGDRFVLRGQRVYDTQGHSYFMPDGLQVLEANVVWFLSWDDCPEIYNRWALARAARAFAGRALGDQSSPRLAALEEQAALAQLEAAEAEQAQANWLTNGTPAWPTFRPVEGLGRNIGWAGA